ncbi:hypothetical protein [Planotetraspora sp. GP83]|uniref:hypothetical protein n=1 Tax=Planotetraspora sp. GP83 TaxID=3156264 RepID=UPI00351804E8
MILRQTAQQSDSPAFDGFLSYGRPGRRYRLRGLMGITATGIVCWAVIIGLALWLLA